MQWFFWAIVGAYVVLYFFAAYLYDGFSFPMAVGLLFLIVAGIYLKYRKGKANADDTPSAPIQHDLPQPLSIWQSPIPYMGALVLVVLIAFVFLR